MGFVMTLFGWRLLRQRSDFLTLECCGEGIDED